MRTLEECVLRVLYEGAATIRECAADLLRDAHADQMSIWEVAWALNDLERRSYVATTDEVPAHYSLTSGGSKRLADLAERRVTTTDDLARKLA